jgi:CubicO group peptidase (beta-lactamase class C family)
MLRRLLSLRLAAMTLGLAACGGSGAGTSGASSLDAPSTVNGAAGGELDAYLGGLAASGRLTGSVLVARHGTVLLSKGYGLADQERRFPDTPATRYRIGSITKQFTAAAILMLQDQGKLHVQDPVCLYVSDCPRAWEAITLHHLLTHTSGIPDYTNFPDFPSLIGRPATVEGLIARFQGRPLEFPPGQRWKYSNSGYVLLGHVVSAVSSLSYAEFLRRSVFEPLQMQASGYDVNAPTLPGHATGYLSPGQKPVFLDMSEFDAAGALASTVEDLFRWDEALTAGRVLSRDALQDMVTPHVPCPTGGCALGSDVGYGYGWFVAEPGGERYVYHWGRIDGFKSSNGFYPREGVDVVLLSNLETTDVFGISTELGARALALP